MYWFDQWRRYTRVCQVKWRGWKIHALAPPCLLLCFGNSVNNSWPLYLATWLEASKLPGSFTALTFAPDDPPHDLSDLEMTWLPWHPGAATGFNNEIWNKKIIDCTPIWWQCDNDNDKKTPIRLLRQLTSNKIAFMQQTTRECVHLAARGHFWTHDKDDGHTIRSAISENPMLHVNFMALCFIEPHSRWKFYMAGIGISTFFALVTLTLSRWLSFANLTCISWRYRPAGCANVKCLYQSFQKLLSDV